MGTVRDEISKNLLYYRKKHGFSQKELAEKLGVKNSSVSNWEHGVNSIDIETLFLACQIFGITVNDMYGMYGDFSNNAYDDETQKAIQMFVKLDEKDKSYVLGEMHALLHLDKYQEKKKKNA